MKCLPKYVLFLSFLFYLTLHDYSTTHAFTYILSTEVDEISADTRGNAQYAAIQVTQGTSY